MNWVGGSRNRLVMRNDAKKQREFFEKRKIQQKLKNLGISLPDTSPGDSGAGSMDLVTLFIVNQIAAKKANKDPPKVAVLGSPKGRSKYKRNEPIVLPMSPCSPSQLSLAEGQSQYSFQAAKKRKNIIPQGFKCQQLSPVLESAYSDNSASDYKPRITEPTSPFSSTSSACSGQGLFPLQLKLQTQSQSQFSPPSWGSSVLQQDEFQPFSQPRGMTDTVPWSCGSNPPFSQLETATSSQVLFGNPEPDKPEARQAVTFSLSQGKGDEESILDFMFNQSQTKQQFEEGVFSGFSNEDFVKEGAAKPKIYLTESSTPQTVPDSQNRGGELTISTDVNLSCPGHNTEPILGCGCLPSYSCGGCYLSSDDDEEGCQPCLQAPHTVATNNAPHGKQNQRLAQPRPQTPLIKSNFKDYQEFMEYMDSADNACGSSTSLFLSTQTQTQGSELCKCKKTSAETRDAETQTAAEMCDALTQCDSTVDNNTEAFGFSLYLTNADDVLEQHPATGRQTDAATKPDTLAASSGNFRSEGKQTPWRQETSKAGSLTGINNKFTANCGKVIMQRPTNPFRDALSRAKEDERGQHETGPLMEGEVKEEVPSATRVDGLSKDAETLQEIADILLLLKQRKKEG